MHGERCAGRGCSGRQPARVRNAPRVGRAALSLSLAAALSTTLTSASPPTPTIACTATIATTQPWATSPTTRASVWEVEVEGPGTPGPWTLDLARPGGPALSPAWNLEADADNSTSWTTLPVDGAAFVGLVSEFVGKETAAPSLPSISLNGAPCKVRLEDPTAPPPARTPASDDAPADAPLPPGMTTKDGQILAPDGTPLFFTGVNWFGWEVGATSVDGLWGGTNAIAKDFPTVVWRLRLLGFNAVRLPFSFTDLWNLQPKPLAYGCAGVTPDAVVAATTAPAGGAAAGFSTAPPLSSAPGPGPTSLASQGMGGACNAGVPGPGSATAPGATTLDRFLWTAGYLAANGFYLLLDNQFNLDQTALRDPALWVTRWTQLATRLVKEQPAAAAMSMLDLLNEPDAWGLAWEARYGKPGMGDLYLRAMDALDRVFPFLYVIEGCGQAGLAKNWGDGIVTDRALITSRGLSDPNPFFNALLGKRYVSRVVAGPHIYGPSVARTSEAMTGPALYKRLSQSFGYLNKKGFCPEDGRPCVRFPVFLGETGTGFLDWNDLQPQMDFAAYAMAGRPGTPPNPAADDGLHNPLSGVFWWCWNSNSEGAMGVVKNDWTAVDWNKVTWLEHVGLRPWWFGSGVATGPASVEGSGGDGDGSAVAVPAPLLRGRAPVRSPAASIGAFTGDLFGWGLRDGGLALGGSTAGKGGGLSPSAEGGSSGGPPAHPHPLSTAGALILGAAGVPTDLRAVTWPAGFTNAGLGALGADAAAGLARVGAAGFNAVKLPLDLERVLAGGPATPPFPASPCPGTGADVAALAAATLPPTVEQTAWTVFPTTAALTNATSTSSASCNSYLPSTSNLARLVGLARLAASAGLYVILEDASGPAGAGLAGASSPAAWAGAWAAIAKAVSPVAGGKLAIRLAADPDVAGVGWVPGLAPPLGPATADAPKHTTTHPGLGALLLATMDAVEAAGAAPLFLIPGAGQAAGMGGITGAGFSSAVGEEAGSAAQADAAAVFLSTLAARPYAPQTVLSPAWQVPSGRAGGAGAAPLAPSVEWAALEGAWGGLTHTYPFILGSFGGPPPPAQLVQATAMPEEGAVAPVVDAGASLSADAASLAALGAWMQPTCGLPACAAAAKAGGHVPLRSWVWDAWTGEEASSTAHPVVLAAPSDGDATTTTAALPPVDWAVMAFLGGLGAVPWFAPPTPEWRGPPPPGPAPRVVEAADADATPTCLATFSISSPGHALNASHAVGLLSLTLTGDGASPHPSSTPYTLIIRPQPGGSFLGLRALAGATDRLLSPSALTATVGDPWAGVGAKVSVAAVLEAVGESGASPAAALAPGGVSVGGRDCALRAA